MSAPSESEKFALTLEEVIARQGAIIDVLCRAGLTTPELFAQDEAFHRAKLRDLARRLYEAGSDEAKARRAVELMEKAISARRTQ